MSQSVAVLGSNVVPLQYKVPVPGTLTALSASGTFDGTNSAAFQPCLSFYDSDGNLLVRATAPVVAAGASAEVSWFPRVGQAAASGGGGIQFDTDNEGGWFFGAVNDAGGGPNGYGWQFDSGTSGLPFAITGDGGLLVADGPVTLNANGFVVNGGAGNSVEADTSGNITETIGAVAPGTHTWSVKSDVGSPLFSVADDGTIDAEGNRITNGADGVAPTDFATVGQLGGTLAVTDNTTTVSPVTEINFTSGAVVTDGGGGVADVLITGGGGGSGQLDYAQITSPVTITGTTDAGATAVISGNAVTYDGSTRVKIECFFGASLGTNSEIIVVIYDGSTDLGRIGGVSNQGAASVDVLVPGALFVTPTAGAHTFSIRAWKIGSASVYAGAGGAGVTLPAWYQITEA